MLFGVAALRSLTTRRFQMRSRLAESVGVFVGVTGVCTLGTDGCMSMERVNLRSQYRWLWAHLEAPAPSELVACWVFAPLELVVFCG